jgi:hypothetical protein
LIGVFYLKEGNMIKPEEMLEMANAQVKKEPYICLEEYGESIHVLYRDKDLTYREIKEWLEEKGEYYSVASISRVHKIWELKNGK